MCNVEGEIKFLLLPSGQSLKGKGSGISLP